MDLIKAKMCEEMSARQGHAIDQGCLWRILNVRLGGSVMKKVMMLTMLLVPQIAFSLISGIYPIDGVEYNLIEINGTVRVNSAKPGSSVRMISIPWTINGLPVTSIASGAFNNGNAHYHMIESITLPPSLVDIGYNAFSGCSALKSITIPSGVTSIEGSAFVGCRELASIDVVSNNSKYCSCDGVLYDKAQKEIIKCPEGKCGAVKIEESVSRICKDAFSGCSGLTRVDIVDLAVWCEIDFGNDYANPLCDAKHLYLNGEEVSDLVVPDGVTSIGDYAFCNCEGLKSAVIPESVINFGDGVFKGCGGLFSISVDSNNSSFSSLDGIMYDKDQSRLICCPEGLIGAVQIPLGTTIISAGAFCCCTRVSSVTIPLSVTSVGEHAFAGCSSLRSIAIPSSVTNIGTGAFCGCELAAVYVADIASWCGVRFGDAEANPLYFAQKLFVNEDEIVDLKIPNNVTSIGDYVFSGCASLLSVEIPPSVTNISGYAFCGCRSLTSVTIPACVERLSIAFPDAYAVIKGVTICDGVTTIGEGLFSGCWSMASVAIPACVTNIGERAFWDCRGLRSVTIPGSVTSIGSSAFSSCIELTSLTISNGVANIGARAFEWCTKMTSVKIPSSVKNVGEYAFYNCWQLKDVTISNGTTTIGRFAFANCNMIESIAIPSSVMCVDGDVFEGCSRLKEITVEENNVSYCSLDGVLYAKPEPELICCPKGKVGSVRILSGVTSIGNYAFNGCIGVTSVIIPSSVTSVGASAFSGCSGLTSVVISTGVTSIGTSAFSGCCGLESVVVPSSVTSIGWSAFAGCNGLTSMVLPFVGSKRGNSGAAEALFGYVFGTSSYNSGNTATMQYYSNWSYTYCNIPSSLKFVVITDETKIGVGAFYGCSGLESVTMSESVTSIGDMAFKGCSGLTSVTIPSSVASVEGRAFSSCRGLISVSIPEGVTSIGDLAFSECDLLAVVYVNKGDAERVRGLYGWPSDVKFVEMAIPVIEGDEGVKVTGDAETGFVIKPSEGKTAVEVTIPQGVDAAKVTVEVSPKVASVKPNGAKVKIVSGNADITEFLNVPAVDGNGVIDLTKATVKKEIVKEALDPAKGAVIELNAANPSLTTSNTRVGLLYTFSEGRTLGGMDKSDSKTGDGQPWSPEVNVKGGNSAFYSIGVGKGE